MYPTLIHKVNAILAQYDYPLTLRQIHYRIVAEVNKDYPNTRSAYNGLSKQLVRAWERGDVDYRRIEDRVRATIVDRFALHDPFALYEMMADQIEAFASHYSRNPWEDQENYVEVWIEKDALSTTISRVATDIYRVPVAVNRGYGSFSFVRKGAERIEANDKSLHVLYFGDFDPSGEDMVRDLQRRIMKYRTGGQVIQVHKIALTHEQIVKHNVPEDLAKPKDVRTKAFIDKHGAKTAELDALPPETLQKIVKDAIEEYIDPKKWQESVDLTLTDKPIIANKVAAVKRRLIGRRWP